MGQWEDDGGMLFTYAKRRDINGDSYECFVGSVDNKGQLFLIEAGPNCRLDNLIHHALHFVGIRNRLI